MPHTATKIRLLGTSALIVWLILPLLPLARGFRLFPTSTRPSPAILQAVAFPAASSSTRLSSTVSSTTAYNNSNSSSSFGTSPESHVDDIDGIMTSTSSTTEQSVVELPEELLETDTYQGVSIRLDHMRDSPRHADYTRLLSHPDVFRTRLRASLDSWRADGRRGIWMYVPSDHAAVVPVATELGFAFHMVNQEGTLVLSQWLPDSETMPSRLPRGPLYQCGVGCVVVKPDDPTKLLAVQELSGPAAASKLWKVPTGLVDPSEDIHEAAVRELKEETGLDATCDGILIFRQSHAASRAGNRAASDLFFMCRMRLTDPTAEWVKQPEEIADIAWMDVDEFCEQTTWKSSPLYAQLNDVCRRAHERDVLEPATLPVKFRNTPAHLTNTLYKLSSSL